MAKDYRDRNSLSILIKKDMQTKNININDLLKLPVILSTVNGDYLMLHHEFPSDLQLLPFHLDCLNPFEKLEVQVSEKIMQQNKHD